MPPRKRKAAAHTEPDVEPADTTGSADDRTKDNAQVPTQDSEGTCTSFEVTLSDKSIACQRRPSSSKKPALIFTHGAGGGLDTPAMKLFMEGFAQISPVVCFKGSMNLQSRVKSFNAVIEHEKWGEALGGRSMGARAAVIAAQQYGQTKALVLASYPLKSPKGDLRDKILLDLDEGVDVLFISGSKDEMCDQADLVKVRKKMKARSWMVLVRGADHGMSMKPAGVVEDTRRRTGQIAAEWLQGRDSGKTECELVYNEDDGEIQLGNWEAGDISKASKPSEGVPVAKKRKKKA